MRAVWDHVSSDIAKKYWIHTTLLGKHDEIDCIDLTPGIENMEEELAEIEYTMAQTCSCSYEDDSE